MSPAAADKRHQKANGMVPRTLECLKHGLPVMSGAAGLSDMGRAAAYDASLGAGRGSSALSLPDARHCIYGGAGNPASTPLLKEADSE